MSSSSWGAKIFLLKVAVSIVLLVVAITLIDWQQFLEALSGIRTELFVLGVLFYLIPVNLQGLRWYYFIRELPNADSMPRILRINYQANYFDIFVPGKLGSDAFRATCLSEKGSTSSIISSLVVMRLQGFVLNVSTLSLLLLYFFPNFRAPILIGGLLSIVTLFVGYRFYRSHFSQLLSGETGIARHIRDCIEFLTLHMRSKRTIVSTSATYMTYLISCAFLYWILALSLGIQLGFLESFLVSTGLSFCAMLPITVQGRGLSELAAIYLFEYLGVVPEAGLLVALLIYILLLLHALFGGLTLPFFRRRLSSEGSWA